MHLSFQSCARVRESEFLTLGASVVIRNSRVKGVEAIAKLLKSPEAKAVKVASAAYSVAAATSNQIDVE